MKNHSTSTYTPGSCTYITENKSGNTWTRSESVGIERYAIFKASSLVGNTTANFLRRKLRPKPLPFQPVYRSFENATGTYGTVIYATDWYRYTRQGYIAGVESPSMCPTEIITKLTHNAKIRLLNKIKDMKINLAQVYAERDQTARLIGDTAIKVAAMITPEDQLTRDNANAQGLSRKARKLSAAAIEANKRSKGYKDFIKRRIKKKVQQAAGFGLAIQYGVRPLLSDCQSAAEQLAKSHLRLPPDERFTTRYNNEYTNRSVFKTSSDLVVREYKGMYTIKMQVTCVIDGTFSMASSLGLTNPALIAWELMPWSFVVDWFYSIGNWVSTWDATIGANFKSGGTTTLDQSRGGTTTTYIGDGYSGQTQCSGRKVILTRTVLTGFPRPGFPPYNDKSSVEHMFNGLLLLSSAVAKLK